MCPFVGALYSRTSSVFWFEDMPLGSFEILHPESGHLFLKSVSIDFELKETTNLPTSAGSVPCRQYCR